MDAAKQAARSHDISNKVAQLYQKRTKLAQEHFSERLSKAYADCAAGLNAKARRAHGGLVALVRVRDRFRAALDPVLGHAARARQRLRRAQPRGAAAAAALRLRDRRRRTHARPPGQLRAGAHRPPGGRDGRSEAAALRDHRPARRPRSRHRRLQGRLAGRRRAARRPSGLLRDLLPRPRAGPDAARRLRGRAAIREEGARAASGEPEARDRRQLPGRLGGDDARRGGSGRHRADRDQRRADVVLGRRIPGGRRRQPDALRRRHAGRHLAVVVRGRPGRRRVRRRVSGREFREPESGQHVLGQVLQPVREHRHRARRASSSSSAGGAAST